MGGSGQERCELLFLRLQEKAMVFHFYKCLCSGHLGGGFPLSQTCKTKQANALDDFLTPLCLFELKQCFTFSGTGRRVTSLP